MTALIIGGVVAVFMAVILLLVRNAKKTGASEEREKVSHDTAVEIKKQADLLVEHRTDSDVVTSLRAKARAKRKRDA